MLLKITTKKSSFVRRLLFYENKSRHNNIKSLTADYHDYLHTSILTNEMITPCNNHVSAPSTDDWF